jgi:hypothetical protein
VIFRSATRSNLTIALDTNCKIGAAESGPARYTHEPAPHQALGPPEPTTTGPGPNSTQKTSLMVEDCPHLYVVLPHHQFPMCALRGNEPPANLHAAEQRSDLPRRTCMITDDNGDTIFVNEVQPKPTSPGHDYGRTSPNHNTGRSGSRQYAVFPCELVAMSSWLQQQPPLIFMRKLGLQSMTRTLPYTTKYNSGPIVTGLYKYSTQYLTVCGKCHVF